MIMKAAKMGQMSSQIGVVLRHQHGIPLVKSIASSKILHILKAHGLAPKILEDLYFLIKKAVAIRKHLERNRKDKDSSFRLILVESRIHRLVRYYKRTKKLPPTLRFKWILFKVGLMLSSLLLTCVLSNLRNGLLC
ncbi:hypothetical protein DAI22_02g286200 [Oryza sativa Japonica Group]|nr:hypothetical protein DAI22_02g286200 [Oryza sativa Japonica Group]